MPLTYRDGADLVTKEGIRKKEDEAVGGILETRVDRRSQLAQGVYVGGNQLHFFVILTWSRHKTRK